MSLQHSVALTNTTSITLKKKEVQYIMLKNNTAKTHYFITNTLGQHLHLPTMSCNIFVISGENVEQVF